MPGLISTAGAAGSARTVGALRAAWVLAVGLAAGALSVDPASAQPYQDIHLMCPCRAETSSLTSVTLTFGLQNFHASESARLVRVSLRARRAGTEDGWQELATAHIPVIEPDSTLEAQSWTVPFQEPGDVGAYEFDLAIMDQTWPVEAIAWISEEIEISAGGSAWLDVYFDGAPKASVSGEEVTFTLPVIRNASPLFDSESLRAALYSTRAAEFSAQDLVAEYALGDLPAGGQIAAQTVTAPVIDAPPGDYLHVAVMRGPEPIVYQTVAVPEGRQLPRRDIATGDASLLVDTDGDGVGDVNERLAGADPNDAGSTPGASTIDVLALYSPGFAELYDGDPYARIQHTMTLADAIFRDSGLDMRLRLVGIAPAELDDSLEDTTPDDAVLASLTEKHGADMAVMYRPYVPPGALCGWAWLGGFRRNGDLEHGATAPLVHVFGDCGAATTAHELGHSMGLGHSDAQQEVGTYRWARGHGVWRTFNTVMAYGWVYESPRELNRFSDPGGDCEGLSCGVAEGAADSANAVRALDAVRFQLEAISEPQADSDGDGFVDPVDAFPNDSSEQRDTDLDGIGNKSDPDDDNDGVIDGGDFYPLDPKEWSNTDGDALGDNADAFPMDPFETHDSDGDGVGDNTDLFPDDPSETVDTDNDGVGNNADPFPYDTREWADSDGDGVGDNADPDADNDGVADTRDVFPADPSRSESASWRFTGSGLPYEPHVAAVSDLGGAPGVALGVPDSRTDAGPSSGVYLLAVADLPAADRADGAADRVVNLDRIGTLPGSWRLVGDGEDAAGYSVAEVGDVDGDGMPELLVGAPDYAPRENDSFAGGAWLVSLSDLPAADRADGAADRTVELERIAAGAKSWQFTGEGLYDFAGRQVAPAGDIDGDGRADLVIAAKSQLHGNAGAIYVVAAADLPAADRADGSADGVIALAQVAPQAASWKLAGEPPTIPFAFIGAVGDMDGSGSRGLMLGHLAQEQGAGAFLYAAAVADLPAADRADGSADGVVRISQIGSRPRSWRFVDGEDLDRFTSVLSPGDIDGDGLPEWMVFGVFKAYLLFGKDMAAADAADGSDDRSISLHNRPVDGLWSTIDYALHFGVPSVGGGAENTQLYIPGSRGETYIVSPAKLADLARGSDRPLASASVWRFRYRSAWLVAGPVADFDGDGLQDLLIGSEREAHLLASADLGILDAADGAANGIIGLSQVAGDSDADGLVNIIDPDDDGDGRDDGDDAFPADPAEWADADGDGVGDNSDAFPSDPLEHTDTDGDGVGDLADRDDDNDGVSDFDDSHPRDSDDDGVENAVDSDDDGDGVADREDAFPLNPDETADSDGDGIGDNADTDDDNDGVPDADDALPFDPLESADRDGDGVGDKGDAFPSNPAESADSDGDGIGDNADRDDDGDGVADSLDAFPLDAAESADRDGDGVGDNSDAFPSNPAETADTDGDGVGDGADSDDDGDGFTDNADFYPLDAERHWLYNYRLTGERPYSRAGASLAAVGDSNGEGQAELLIGAPVLARARLPVSFGAAYLLSGADAAPADRADGVADGLINLRHVAAQASSWAVAGSSLDDHAGESAAPADARRWLLGVPGQDYYRGAAYLVSPADLEAADAVDGSDGVVDIDLMPRQPNSWSFVGEQGDNETGRQVLAVGDVHGDGITDYLLSAPAHENTGAVWLVSGVDLDGADAADGEADHRIELAHMPARSGSWKLMGHESGGRAGEQLAAAGDFDGDGLDDFIVTAPWSSPVLRHQGTIYVMAAAGLAPADAADGSADGVVELGRLAEQDDSWTILGENELDFAGAAAAAADIDGDGRPELIVGAPEHGANTGAVYILPFKQFAAADSADGSEDRTIRLGNGVAALEGAWKLVGEQGGGDPNLNPGAGAGTALASGDLDGDGRAEILIGAPNHLDTGVWCDAPGRQRQTGAVYLVDGAGLPAADRLDGEADGVVRLDKVAGVPRAKSRKFVGEATDRLGSAMAFAGDLNGDGRTDLAFGAAGQFGSGGGCGVAPGKGAAIILSGAELALADGRDGRADGVIDFGALREFRRSQDFDFDGLEDALDADDDNDGVADGADAFPRDAGESADHDHDGIGDNADPDDDNDGAPDHADAFPLTSVEWLDSDGDGIGDNADPDDDNDGVSDDADAFPLDPLETLDSDGDGVGDNADPTPLDASMDADGDGIADSRDTDDDNDGASDWDDAYPKDAARQDPFFLTLKQADDFFFSDDFDGDGHDDLVAQSQGSPGVWMWLSSADLAEAGGQRAGSAGSGGTERVIEIGERPPPPQASWKLTAAREDRFASAGDVDADMRADLIAGDLLVAAAALSAADSRDGDSDRSIRLADLEPAQQDGIWRFDGNIDQWIRYGLADVDGDGHKDLLIGREGFPAAVYVLSGADWAFATRGGASAGVIMLDALASRPGSWKLVNSDVYDFGGSVAAGDVDGDGRDDLLIGAEGLAVGTNPRAGGVYLAPSGRLAAADAADGTADGIIRVGRSGGSNVQLLAGDTVGAGLSVASPGDVDGDGLSELIIASFEGAKVLSSAQLAGADAADGAADGVIDLGEAARQTGSLELEGRYNFDRLGKGLGDVDGDGRADILMVAERSESAHLIVSRDLLLPVRRNSWQFRFESRTLRFSGMVSAGDMDGDGMPELALGVSTPDDERFAYLISLSELAALDRLDLALDRVIHLDRVARRW